MDRTEACYQIPLSYTYPKVYTVGALNLGTRESENVGFKLNSFVFRKTRLAIEAVRGAIAVGNVVLNIWGMDGMETLIPTRIVIPTVILQVFHVSMNTK